MAKQKIITAEEYRKIMGVVTTKAVEKIDQLPYVMNKTELRFSQILAGREDVVWQSYEALQFRLAKRTTYTPDFIYVSSTVGIVAAEVKGGFFRDDARAKWKIAAAMYPYFTWEWWQWKDGEWKCETYTETKGGQS